MHLTIFTHEYGTDAKVYADETTAYRGLANVALRYLEDVEDDHAIIREMIQRYRMGNYQHVVELYQRHNENGETMEVAAITEPIPDQDEPTMPASELDELASEYAD